MRLCQYISERRILKFKRKIRIASCGCTGGKKEGEGPLGKYFDKIYDSPLASEKSFEKAEASLCREALRYALDKSGLCDKSIDILLAGDLLNQCSGTGYGLEDFDIPYFGLYGACSTCAEGLINAALMIESGLVNCAAVVVSSHFCSAERQFRFPLSYGSFALPTAQNTVTGSGAFILCNEDKFDFAEKSAVYVTEALPGIVCDSGINDAGNMGAAMCCAAADTISRYIGGADKGFSDFDLVSTGDLGWEGTRLLSTLLKENAEPLKSKLTDCGLLVYDIGKQSCGCGGSGCGCSAVVTAGYFFDALSKGDMTKIALIGTGAMMSPKSLYQGMTIPSVAHLVTLSSKHQ